MPESHGLPAAGEAAGRLEHGGHSEAPRRAAVQGNRPGRTEAIARRRPLLAPDRSPRSDAVSGTVHRAAKALGRDAVESKTRRSDPKPRSVNSSERRGI